MQQPRPSLAVALALSLGAALAARSAAADPPAPAAGGSRGASSSLGWSRLPGAESCIGSSELARSVEKLIGRPVFVSAAEAELAVEGHVEPLPHDGGWRAVLGLSDRKGAPLGTRTIDTAERSCRALDAPASLAVALMIDPDALGGPPPLPPPAPPETRIVPVYLAVPVPGPEPEPWRIAGRGGLALGLGVLPGPTPGLDAAVVIEPPGFLALEATAAAYLPRPAAKDGATARFGIAMGGIAICPFTRRFDALELSLCAGVELGSLWADGSHADGSDYAQHQLVANLGSRLRVSYRVWGPLSLGAGFAGAIALLRPPFEARGAAGAVELFRLGPLCAVPDLTAGLHFP